MPRGSLKIFEFSERNITSLLGGNCATKYLSGYLTTLGTKSIVVEGHYVDRHFLDDFAAYYSKSFNSPSPTCLRLHFFSATSQDINQIFEKGYLSENRLISQKNLQSTYQGFVVKRPLASATIGRSVLKTYPENGKSRRYSVVRPYVVHLAGFRLCVDGLAYQQQDRGAAVCASTALWAALQRVAYVAGHRSPTPIAITNAARSPYPASHGLDESQMAAALSSHGYIADYLLPSPNIALFKTMICSSLQSQLPVVLMMAQKQKSPAGEAIVGHAVTVTGFREPTTVCDVPSLIEGFAPLRMKAASIEVIYVHDDNLGSHAHYELLEKDKPSDIDPSKTVKALFIKRGNTKTPSPEYGWWTVDEWEVNGALVPKPDKMRLPIDSLISDLFWLRPLFDLILKEIDTHLGARFTTGIEYLDSLFKMKLENTQRRAFHAEFVLPRFVGIISVHHDNEHLLDIVLDASEVERNQVIPSILGFVAPGFPSKSPAFLNLQVVSRKLSVPLIGG